MVTFVLCLALFLNRLGCVVVMSPLFFSSVLGFRERLPFVHDLDNALETYLMHCAFHTMSTIDLMGK